MAATAALSIKLAGDREQRRRPYPEQYSSDTLPRVGRGRWGVFAPFVGVSREKWRQLVRDGKAPQPLRMGTRCALYDFEQIHAWIADPVNYRA